MEGLNNGPQLSKLEQAEKAIFEHFGKLPNLAIERVIDSPNYNSLSERVDF